MEIWVFACQHRVPEDWRPPFAPEELMGQKVRLIQLPCSAKLSTVHMLRPFERGIYGILVMACSEEGCRSLEGSRRAKMRVREANNVLEEVGLGSSRVMLKQEDGSDRESYFSAIREIVARTEKSGPTPVRGDNRK